MNAGVRSQALEVRGQALSWLLAPGFWLLISLLVLLAALPLASAQEVQLEQEVFEVSRGLRCPTCDSESVADSHASVSVEMRQIVREQLQEGRSQADIHAYFAERYGDWILMNPPRRGVHLIVWLAPVVAGLAGLAALGYYLRQWTRQAEQPLEADPHYLERVRQELQPSAADGER